MRLNVVCVQSSAPSAAALSSAYFERDTLQEIKEAEARIKNICWDRSVVPWLDTRLPQPSRPSITPLPCKTAILVFKGESIQIGLKFLELSESSCLKGDPEGALGYWKKGLAYSANSCRLRACRAIDYQNWFDIASFHLHRVKWHQQGTAPLKNEKTLKHVYKGLEATNEALRCFKNKPEALLHRFRFLQILVDLGQLPAEEPKVWLRLHLEHYPDRSSDEYLKNAQLYGTLLVKAGELEKAKSWFEGLLEQRKDATTFLIVGKIANGQGENLEALENFQRASELAPENLEIRLWLGVQRIRNINRELDERTELPDQQQREQIVEFFDRFYDIFQACQEHLDQSSSIQSPLLNLLGDLFPITLTEIAGRLIVLKDYELAGRLYQKVLDLSDDFLALNLLDRPQKVRALLNVGALYFFENNKRDAEHSLRQALQLAPDCVAIYQNLSALCAPDKEKLIALAEEIEPLINSHPFKNSAETSSLLFNIAQGYRLLGQEGMGSSVKFYKLSLKQDPGDLEIRLQYARVLVLRENKGDLEEAETVLLSYPDEAHSDDPFQDTMAYRIYFCLSAILALNGKKEEAKQKAIAAGRLHVDPEEVRNLQSYLHNGFDDGGLTEIFREQFKESIRKIGFECRVGKFLDVRESVEVAPGGFVGYHGTSSVYLDNFREGILPQQRKWTQFSGKGFYITEDKWMARFFARNTARKEGGTPVLLEIYTKPGKRLIGERAGNMGSRRFKKIKVSGNSKKISDIKIPADAPKQYDFLEATTSGFDDLLQRYVYEESLDKLAVRMEEVESVIWTEEDARKEAEYWKRVH